MAPGLKPDRRRRPADRPWPVGSRALGCAVSRCPTSAASECSPSAIRSPTAAASSSGAWRCNRGPCGSRAASGCRSPATRPTERSWATWCAARSRRSSAQPPTRPRATTSGASTSGSTTSAGRTGIRDAFADDHRRVLEFLTARCDRTLAVTAPLRLGVPPAGAKVGELNAAIEANARALGGADRRSEHVRGAQLRDGRSGPPDGLRAGGDRRASAGGPRPGRAADPGPAGVAVRFETDPRRATARGPHVRLPVRQAAAPALTPWGISVAMPKMPQRWPIIAAAGRTPRSPPAAAARAPASARRRPSASASCPRARVGTFIRASLPSPSRSWAWTIARNAGEECASRIIPHHGRRRSISPARRELGVDECPLARRQ